jgi:hypothetical protein
MTTARDILREFALVQEDTARDLVTCINREYDWPKDHGAFLERIECDGYSMWRVRVGRSDGHTLLTITLHDAVANDGGVLHLGALTSRLDKICRTATSEGDNNGN